MKVAPFSWIRNVSIARKLYFTVGIMASLVAIELFALFFSITTLSSLRAYVGGEGLWSKAQKDAVYNLDSYAITRNETYYLHFREYMKVVLGDRKARMEMGALQPDWDKVKEGFLEGRNNPDDIDGMIKLFRRFRKSS